MTAGFKRANAPGFAQIIHAMIIIILYIISAPCHAGFFSARAKVALAD
jgi:hypothetical protein